MEDAGQSVSAASRAVKVKSVPSDRNKSSAGAAHQRSTSHEEDGFGDEGEEEKHHHEDGVDGKEEKQLETALPRSHTPGRLASKSAHGRHHKSSDLTIRRRSQSASHTASASALASASTPVPKPPLTTNVADRAAEDQGKEEKRPSTSKSNLAAATRKAQCTPSTVSQSVKATEPPQGPHVPFPPPLNAKDHPDVELAPPSGMYWSKAMVSGSPHSNFRAHTATVVGSNVYVFGGCDARACFNSLYVLDADAFYWSVPHVVGDIPAPLRAMTCTAVGKKLVVFGGGDGPAYYNDVYVLDTVIFRWTKSRILGDRFPSKRRAHTACLYKGGVFVFGGGDGVRALNDVWRLDVSDVNKMSWKLICGPDKSGSSGEQQTRPKARGYHTANMVGSKLIVFGGSDGGECFDDVWIYDVETHIWRLVNVPLTYRRLSHTANIVGSYLFVLGGHDGDDYCNDLLLLNLVTMTWDKRKAYGKPPRGRGYHGTIYHDSRLLMIGGFDGSEVFGDVFILELASHAYYSQISHFKIDV